MTGASDKRILLMVITGALAVASLTGCGESSECKSLRMSYELSRDMKDFYLELLEERGDELRAEGKEPLRDSSYLSLQNDIDVELLGMQIASRDGFAAGCDSFS